MKRIFFRVDSSFQIGSGHLMRCLTLAKRLREEAEISFVCRDLTGNLNHLIRKNNYILYELPKVALNQSLNGYEKWLTVKPTIDAKETRAILDWLGTVDLLIVDSYAIDKTWETMLRGHVKRLMVIDDLANRQHDCDILLDQNYYRDYQNRYQGLVSSECKLLIGPRYVILRDEFYAARKNLRVRNGEIRNIFLFFGGSDPTNETMKAVRAVIRLKQKNIIVNVVVGERNPHRNDIEELCRTYEQLHFHCQIDYMAQLMSEADLAIGAGGTATWERCFLGLPAIVIAVAENQVKICQDCALAGYIIYLGKSEVVDEKQIYEMLHKVIVLKDWMSIKNPYCLEGERDEWIHGLLAFCEFE